MSTFRTPAVASAKWYVGAASVRLFSPSTSANVILYKIQGSPPPPLQKMRAILTGLRFTARWHNIRACLTRRPTNAYS